MRLRAPDARRRAGRPRRRQSERAPAIVARPTTGGRSAYWARQGDILALSTNRREIEAGAATRPGRRRQPRPQRRAALHAHELPVRAGHARARLPVRSVHPAHGRSGDQDWPAASRARRRGDVAHHRRRPALQARRPHATRRIWPRSTRLGYVPAGGRAAGLPRAADSPSSSTKWGTLAELTTIETAAIETATREEADAYQTYVDEYRRYWRQFFDPIAMRLDDAPDGALELSTFILPLIDSELYNRRWPGSSEAMNKPLRVPHTKPEPVFQLSLNLSDDAWAGLSSGFRDDLLAVHRHQRRAVRPARAGPAHRHAGRRPDHLVRHVGSAGRVRRLDVRRRGWTWRFRSRCRC